MRYVSRTVAPRTFLTVAHSISDAHDNKRSKETHFTEFSCLGVANESLKSTLVRPTHRPVKRKGLQNLRNCCSPQEYTTAPIDNKFTSTSKYFIKNNSLSSLDTASGVALHERSSTRYVLYVPRITVLLRQIWVIYGGYGHIGNVFPVHSAFLETFLRAPRRFVIPVYTMLCCSRKTDTLLTRVHNSHVPSAPSRSTCPQHISARMLLRTC